MGQHRKRPTAADLVGKGPAELKLVDLHKILDEEAKYEPEGLDGNPANSSKCADDDRQVSATVADQGVPPMLEAADAEDGLGTRAVMIGSQGTVTEVGCTGRSKDESDGQLVASKPAQPSPELRRSARLAAKQSLPSSFREEKSIIDAPASCKSPSNKRRRPAEFALSDKAESLEVRPVKRVTRSCPANL